MAKGYPCCPVGGRLGVHTRRLGNHAKDKALYHRWMIRKPPLPRPRLCSAQERAILARNRHALLRIMALKPGIYAHLSDQRSADPNDTPRPSPTDPFGLRLFAAKATAPSAWWPASARAGSAGRGGLHWRIQLDLPGFGGGRLGSGVVRGHGILQGGEHH